MRQMARGKDEHIYSGRVKEAMWKVVVKALSALHISFEFATDGLKSAPFHFVEQI